MADQQDDDTEVEEETSARDIWRSYKRPNYETRGVLKTYNHGRMCHPVVHHARYIRGAVHNAGLRWVMKCTSPSVDQSIISAFVERWHPETSSFHLPWGEMTITLEDVSALLHLPVEGEFFSFGNHTREEAAPAVAQLLDVDIERVMEEFDACRGPSLRFSFLQAIVEKHVEANNEVPACRAYMLRL
ncbi:uncharacterized protein LOC130719832 [Lotus japonicus]|uniref:uncharacterized protein LOC130719832 n=1 Tax=Lotus japonicus TaxID=34305 RepID=UPI00258547F3|nr:uncharacterized protein LOC130719832 [Lotus japonicus]